MDLGAQGALGQVEGSRHLGVGEVVDESQQDGFAVAGGQGAHTTGP